MNEEPLNDCQKVIRLFLQIKQPLVCIPNYAFFLCLNSLKYHWHLWRRVRREKSDGVFRQHPKSEMPVSAQVAELTLTPERVFCSVLSFAFCADCWWLWAHRNRKMRKEKRGQQVDLTSAWEWASLLTQRCQMF